MEPREMPERMAAAGCETFEIQRLRLRLFGNRQVVGHNHSTACSIWGEDGQGNVHDIPGPHPCNCGALLNFKGEEIDRLQKEIDGLREVLITISDRLSDHGCQCDSSDEVIYKCNLCIIDDALMRIQ